MVRRVAAVVFALSAMLLLPVAAVLVATPAGAQDDVTTTTLVPIDEQQQPRTPSIIPIPNSGNEPVEQGDPGSAAQYAVLAVTVAGLALIGVLIGRESKKNAANRTRLSDPGETGSEPAT